MIGINNQGQVKVWMNRNYWEAKAKPSYLLLKAGTKETAEKTMTEELKEIFRCKTDRSSIPEGFSLES